VRFPFEIHPAPVLYAFCSQFTQLTLPVSPVVSTGRFEPFTATNLSATFHVMIKIYNNMTVNCKHDDWPFLLNKLIVKVDQRQ
jgi:hypothetical protein